MASTTIPDVKDALLEMLVGIRILKDNNVDVRYAEAAERRRHSVWLGETQLSEIEPAGFRSGRHRRHESFTVAIHIEARATKPSVAERTAFSYARSIEECLADDPKLNETTSLSWAVVEEIESQVAESGDAAFCEIEMTVRCKGNFV